MNVGEVLNTVEKSLLSRQLSYLERFILCQSWVGRGYSEMAPECAYSIAHIKDIGSQLWQTLSKALGERVTKKNLFLVLKQYLLSLPGETVTSDSLSVTLELVEVIDPPLTPRTTNQLPVATDLVEASYSKDSDQLPQVDDRHTANLFYCRRRSANQQQKCQTSIEHTQTENNLKAPVAPSEPTIPSDCLPLDSPLYINRAPIAELCAQVFACAPDAHLERQMGECLRFLLSSNLRALLPSVQPPPENFPDLETLWQRILQELRLGRQAPGYRTAR